MTPSPDRAVPDPGYPPTARGEVLVTGAAGFIGQHLVRACRRAGWAVTALDIREATEEIATAARTLRVNSADPDVLAEVRAGRYAAVLHQGAISSTLQTDVDLLYETNVRQPLALAAACAQGAARFIYASSHSVYGRISRRIAVPESAVGNHEVCSGPLNRYADSKLALDEAMQARHPTGLHWTGLRYTNVFGTDEEHKGSMASIISQLLRQTAQGQRLRLFADTLNACRDYLPVASVAATTLLLLERTLPPGIYNLGSGRPVSFATLLEWCATLRGGDGIEVSLVPNPISDRYQYWTCADLGRIVAALPGFQIPPVDEILSATQALFHTFSSQPVRAVQAS